jgi:uncharacterized protein YaaW (UPF0174 family)
LNSNKITRELINEKEIEDKIIIDENLLFLNYIISFTNNIQIKDLNSEKINNNDIGKLISNIKDLFLKMFKNKIYKNSINSNIDKQIIDKFLKESCQKIKKFLDQKIYQEINMNNFKIELSKYMFLI